MYTRGTSRRGQRMFRPVCMMANTVVIVAICKL